MSDGLEYDEGYREYLRPGDLRTASDVLAWLREQAIAADEGFVSRASTLDEAHAALAARLDRERRQACRRAALKAWRRFAVVARSSAEPRYRGHFTDLVWGSRSSLPRIGEETRRDLADALAFREEARRP